MGYAAVADLLSDVELSMFVRLPNLQRVAVDNDVWHRVRIGPISNRSVGFVGKAPSFPVSLRCRGRRDRRKMG